MSIGAMRVFSYGAQPLFDTTLVLVLVKICDGKIMTGVVVVWFQFECAFGVLLRLVILALAQVDLT